MMSGPYDNPTPRASQVLFVEDDEMFADVAIELLRSLALVEWVTSAEQALGREDWELTIASRPTKDEIFT